VHTVRRTKLFRAIVGLGLASAGCGGKTSAQSLGSGSAIAGRDANGTDVMDAGHSSVVNDAQAAAEVAPAPGVDATLGDEGGDAEAVADVASDVAKETWQNIPIR
jgi:hypothetical protein